MTPLITHFTYTSLFRSRGDVREGRQAISGRLEERLARENRPGDVEGQRARTIAVLLRDPGERRLRHPGWLRSQACDGPDRKSTRLNSSHLGNSYAVFCL